MEDADDLHHDFLDAHVLADRIDARRKQPLGDARADHDDLADLVTIERIHACGRN